MDVKRLLIDALLYAMEGENPSKAIENQERREQMNVINNCRLPKKTNVGITDDYRFKGITDDSMEWEQRVQIEEKNNCEFTKRQYGKMGIQIVEEYDDLFYSAKLPKGWEIKATEHYMWNDVIDDQGRKRISFFYKGSFYDRKAFSNFYSRYSFQILPFDEYKSDVPHEVRKFKPWKLFVTDGGVKFELLKEMVATSDDEYYMISDTLREYGKQYLDTNYPGWEDINSYW